MRLDPKDTPELLWNSSSIRNQLGMCHRFPAEIINHEGRFDYH
jgi:hypothetical protein